MDKQMEMPQGEALEKAMAAAYKVYQENIRDTGELIYRLSRGAKGDMPEKELLEIAMEAVSRCRFSTEQLRDGGKEHGEGAAV